MQLFIRLGKSEEDCRILPAGQKHIDGHQFWFKTLPGTRNIKESCPITANKLFNNLDRYFPLEQFFCISLIGDEPLAQIDFLSTFLPRLRQAGLMIFAESSAPSIRGFARLIKMIDLLCLDLEIPRKKHTNDREIKRLTRVLALTSPATTYLRLTVDAHESPHILLSQLAKLPIKPYTLILQPRMSGLSHISDWDTGTILGWINLFAPLFAQIRWIPQVHKLLRIP